MKNKMHRLTSADIPCSKNRRCTEAVSFCKYQRKKKALHTRMKSMEHIEKYQTTNSKWKNRIALFVVVAIIWLEKYGFCLVLQIFFGCYIVFLFFFCFLIWFSSFSQCCYCCCFLFVCRSYIYIWFLLRNLAIGVSVAQREPLTISLFLFH